MLSRNLPGVSNNYLDLLAIPSASLSGEFLRSQKQQVSQQSPAHDSRRTHIPVYNNLPCWERSDTSCCHAIDIAMSECSTSVELLSKQWSTGPYLQTDDPGFPLVPPFHMGEKKQQFVISWVPRQCSSQQAGAWEAAAACGLAVPLWTKLLPLLQCFTPSLRANSNSTSTALTTTSRAVSWKTAAVFLPQIHRIVPNHCQSCLKEGMLPRSRGIRNTSNVPYGCPSLRFALLTPISAACSPPPQSCRMQLISEGSTRTRETKTSACIRFSTSVTSKLGNPNQVIANWGRMETSTKLSWRISWFSLSKHCC